MARPKFYVQHFVACLNAAWEGLPGPRTARTLEGVIHRFGVPPSAEPEFLFDEVWLYARLFRTNQGEGTREFSIRVVWLDAPGGAREVLTQRFTPVRLSNVEPVANVAWPLRPMTFPGLGTGAAPRAVAMGDRCPRVHPDREAAMKRPNKRGKRVVPQPGGESFQIGEAVGPPIYHLPRPEKATRVIPVPLDEWQIGEALPPRGKVGAARPLVPASEEVAKLPRAAREAFAARCRARVARFHSDDATPEGVAALILAAATVQTPIRRQLLCLRRDFDRLVYLAKKNNWTDDTPVPPELFGPMWPKDLTPDWAKEPTATSTPDLPQQPPADPT